MENKNYTIGQEFSITERTPNQNITKIVVKDIRKSYSGMGETITEYKITFFHKHEMIDGTFKKSQSSDWYNTRDIQDMMTVSNIVEKN